MKLMVKQAGLTLVELLIASVVGLLLMLGVAQLFITSSDTFRMAESVGRMQESGRLAHEIMGRAIRNADYWGCLAFAEVDSILDDSPGTGFDPDLHDFQNPAAVQFFIGDGTTAAAGTVGINLKGTRTAGISMTGIVPASAVIDVSVLPPGLLGPGSVVLLSDCKNGVVFQLSSVLEGSLKLQHNTGAGETPGNIKSGGGCPNGSSSANCFPDDYTSGDIFVAFAEQYYILETGGRRSLVMEDLTSTGPRELISDVIDMQVQVGLGPQGDNTITSWVDVTAANLATVNSGFVKMVRLSLLVRSPEDRVARELQEVCFPAWTDCSTAANLWKPASAADRHYYRVYNSTYSIRNRLLNTP